MNASSANASLRFWLPVVVSILAAPVAAGLAFVGTWTAGSSPPLFPLVRVLFPLPVLALLGTGNYRLFLLLVPAQVLVYGVLVGLGLRRNGRAWIWLVLLLLLAAVPVFIPVKP